MVRYLHRLRSHSMGTLVIGAVVLALVACGGSASSVAPVSTVPSAAPTATPAPSVDGNALAKAVVAKLQADPLIVHVDQVADAEIVEASAGSAPKGTKVQTTMSFDFNGDDMRALMTLSFGGQTTEFEIVALGDTLWAREGASVFGSQPRSAESDQQLIDQGYVRLTDDPGVLRYVGPETIDGRELHRLTALPGAIPYTTGTFDALDLYVLEDGTPVLAKGTFTGKGDAGEVLTGTISLEFSDFGGPITIEAPSTSP